MLRSLYAALMFAVLAINLPVSAQPKYEKPSDIPVEAFAALPAFSNAKLSPNGNAIAYGMQSKGRKTIVYQNLDGSDRGFFAAPKDGEIESFYWSNDNIILIKLGTVIRRVEYTQELFNSRLMALNIKTKKLVWLGKPETRRTFADDRKKLQRASQIETIIDFLWNDPDHILMGLDFDLDARDEVFRVNVYSGKRKLIRSQRQSIYSWHTDHNSKVRLGTGYYNDKKFTIFRKEDGEWINLDKADWNDSLTFAGFTTDQNIIYASGKSQHGTLGLYKVQVETGKVLEEVFTHPKYDFQSVTYHPVTGHVSGVSYIDDHYRVKYFDKDLARIKRGIDKALPKTNNYIVGRAKAKRTYLIYSDSDTLPGAYYLFDRDKGQLGLITATYPKLDISQSASTQAVSIPVRDSNVIPAYLTIPNNINTPSNLVAVILPHGGPASRSTADWDYMAQFLASRGYLVLQPNFRGSTGYGVDFQAQGENQWGGLMQDDVTDATHWLINQGYADPKRICIVGASYGGYAALMGSIKEPQLYQCAVSINGVADMPAMKSKDRRMVGGKEWGETWGLEGSKDEEISPYDRADEINTPVLLISSRNDRRVPYTQSKKMYKKLKKLGKTSRYVQMNDGDHYLMTAESRMVTLRETEKFLAKHIGK